MDRVTATTREEAWERELADLLVGILATLEDDAMNVPATVGSVHQHTSLRLASYPPLMDKQRKRVLPLLRRSRADARAWKVTIPYRRHEYGFFEIELRLVKGRRGCLGGERDTLTTTSLTCTLSTGTKDMWAMNPRSRRSSVSPIHATAGRNLKRERATIEVVSSPRANL